MREACASQVRGAALSQARTFRAPGELVVAPLWLVKVGFAWIESFLYGIHCASASESKNKKYNYSNNKSESDEKVTVGIDPATCYIRLWAVLLIARPNGPISYPEIR